MGKTKPDHWQNKRRCILGKDLCHSKRIFFALPLGPADATLLLRELAFPVPLALLLAPSRPDKGRGYKFYEMRCFKYHNGPNTDTMNVPGLANTVAPPKAPSKMRIGVSTKRGPISTSDISGGPLGCRGSFSIIYPEKNKRKYDSKPSPCPKRELRGKQQVVPDLKIAEPNFGVEDGKREDVVDERLGSSSLGRYPKYLFFHTDPTQKKRETHNEHFVFLRDQKTSRRDGRR